MRSFGIAFIAGCEWVLGFYLGFYTLLSISAIVSKYRHPEHVLATCLAAVGSGIACALVFKTGSGLYKGKRWAFFLGHWGVHDFFRSPVFVGRIDDQNTVFGRRRLWVGHGCISASSDVD